jgi:hypothetical protein
MVKVAYIKKDEAMEECSKLWRWFEGMVPS